MKHQSMAGLSVLAGMAALAISVAARGATVPIFYTSQDRIVTAVSSATGFPESGTNSTPVTQEQSESQQASGYVDFSGNVAAESSIGPDSAGASASAVQQSMLGETGFSASGSVVADSVFGFTDGPVNSSALSMFQIKFNVAQAESYEFTADLNAVTDPAEPDATSATITLTRAKSGKNIFTPITSVSLPDDTVEGTLNPGNYLFTLDTQVGSNDANQNSINYGITLTTAPVEPSPDGTGPAGSSAIPLPSSGWTTLAMLSALVIGGLVRRRIPAWVRMSML